MLKQFIILAPELMLIILALVSQLLALFTDRNKLIINIVIVLSSLIILAVLKISCNDLSGFNDSFATNNITGIYKAVALAFTIITIIIYRDYCKISQEQIKIEFITLSLLSTVGIFISLSSRNFLLLFCAIELQALISYVLAGFNLNNIKSSEGALKYFILGALVSCLSLFGLSFIYGFGASLEFVDIFHKLNDTSNLNLGLIIGVVLFLSSLFFKLSSVPLHSWAPDVYEGSPIYSVTYFATVGKIGMVALLLNMINFIVGEYTPISINLIKIISILSMIVGATGAIRQTSLKRLMAYSTILNIGYVLLGVALHTEQGNFAAMLYMIIYAVGIIGFFTCLIVLLKDKADNSSFEDIKGIASSRKAIAASITIIMFSMIGIPPLAGFLGKYYLFYQAIESQEFLLAFIGVFTSVIAAYYYLKIIKTMYFVDTEEQHNIVSVSTHSLSLIIIAVVCFSLFAAFFISF